MAKAKNVKRAEVMADIRSTKGSVCQIIKGLYSYKGEETKKLNKVLPSNANDLCALASRICEEMRVGQPTLVRVKGADGKAMKTDKGEYVVTEKKNDKGEVVLVKFTQALLITWVLRHQGEELRNMCKEVAAARKAFYEQKEAERLAAKTATEEVAKAA